MENVISTVTLKKGVYCIQIVAENGGQFATPSQIVVTVTVVWLRHGPVIWAVRTAETRPQSRGSGLAQMAVLYSLGIQYLYFPSSQTRWRPLQKDLREKTSE